jgi:ParB-like chromosome segregation protein Spo0J
MPYRITVENGRQIENGQQSFLPEERFTPTLADIPLDMIRGNTLEPGAGFVENIRRVGLLNPVTVVRRDGRGGNALHFDLAAGRRRVAAMRQIRGVGGAIPANVFPSGTPMSIVHAMSISENAQRRPNPLTDLRAIEALVAQGASEEQIARELHLPTSTIRSRMRLAALIPELREAMEADRMSPSTGERAARLNVDQQSRLAGHLAASETNRITMDDVAALLRVNTAAQVEALPEAVFATPTTPPQAVAGPTPELLPGWPGVLQSLVQAERLMPAASNSDMESAAAWLHDLAELVNSIIRAGTP